MKRIVIGLAVSTALLGACVSPQRAGQGAADASKPAGSLTTDVKDAAGLTMARATVDQAGDGLRVRVEAMGMRSGTYGAHVHSIGRCDAPGFTTAGPHWNPTGQQHGKSNPQGMHKGDLPNLAVGTDGRGSFEVTIPGARIVGGNDPLLDADGAAIVIHASADDYRTDPSGNSGGRIACGVIQ